MELKEVLKKIEHNTLTGKQAHQEFAPFSYRSRSEAFSKAADYKLAAVLILLYPSSTGLNFVLTQRHTYKGAHSGQVSLPGGKIEPGETHAAAALRETEEEIGVSSIRIVKGLSDLYIPHSNFLVKPFVGLINQPPLFRLDEYEVKEVLEVQLDALLYAEVKQLRFDNHQNMEIRLHGVPSFRLSERNVWGATAMILNEFRQLLLN